MLIVHVYVHVKPESVPAFIEATLENAIASRRESGVAQFDLLQRDDDPLRFLLLEVYRDAAGAAAHKETAHYAKWRDAVAEMMAEPRYSHKYHAL
jgi:quinol monooxygenase YgiN